MMADRNVLLNVPGCAGGCGSSVPDDWPVIDIDVGHDDIIQIRICEDCVAYNLAISSADAARWHKSIMDNIVTKYCAPGGSG